MSELPIRKKILLGGLALCTFAVPIIFGAAAQSDVANLVPMVRVAPTYPAEALQAGREGVVELTFTIAADGTTKNVAVIDASSPEFEAPAVAALLRWRYDPEDTGATERYDVRTTIRFQLTR